MWTTSVAPNVSDLGRTAPETHGAIAFRSVQISTEVRPLRAVMRVPLRLVQKEAGTGNSIHGLSDQRSRNDDHRCGVCHPLARDSEKMTERRQEAVPVPEVNRPSDIIPAVAD